MKRTMGSRLLSLLLSLSLCAALTPAAGAEEPAAGSVTVTPPVEDETLSEGDVTVLPAEPCPAPEDPLVAVFLS